MACEQRGYVAVVQLLRDIWGDLFSNISEYQWVISCMVLIALVALVIVFSPYWGYKSSLLVPSSDKFLVGRMAYIVVTPFYSGILKHLKLQKYATQPFHLIISFSKTAYSSFYKWAFHSSKASSDRNGVFQRCFFSASVERRPAQDRAERDHSCQELRSCWGRLSWLRSGLEDIGGVSEC